MKSSVSMPLGGIVLLDKVDKEYGFFRGVFGGVGGRMKEFRECVKLLVYNRLTHAVSVHRVGEVYPGEVAMRCGCEGMPVERRLYRVLERVGRRFPLVHERYQKWIDANGLVDSQQALDFSSFYFEGSKADLAEFGHSRDHRSDRPQITFGISTGLNGIPSALTVQKGNVQDKTHMREILKVVEKVMPESSLLIFDCGGNTRANKQKVQSMGCHYLTLKPKHPGTFLPRIKYFNKQYSQGNVYSFEHHHKGYFCAKQRKGKEVSYIFFSPQRYADQMKSRERKFQRAQEKGSKQLRKRKPTRFPTNKGWVELVPQLQHTLTEIENPYISGMEGFFILESSVDDDPREILRLYKDRDKAEKFIRALKEGIELRPIRHWNKHTIIGALFVAFLANLLINLTAYTRKKSLAGKTPNTKLLKKYLTNLTLTTVYPPNTFKYTILSNITPVIHTLFGDFIHRYDDKTLTLRW